MKTKKKLTAVEIKEKAKSYFAKAQELEKKENEKIGRELRKILQKEDVTIQEIRELVK